MSAGKVKVMGDGIMTTIDVQDGDTLATVLTKAEHIISSSFTYMQGDRTLNAEDVVVPGQTIAVAQRESNG